MKEGSYHQCFQCSQMGPGDIPGSGLVHEEEERKQQIFLASSHSFPWSPHFYRFTIEDPFMNPATEGSPGLQISWCRRWELVGKGMASQLAPWPSMAWGPSQQQGDQDGAPTRQHLPFPLAPSVLLSKIYPREVECRKDLKVLTPSLYI